MAMQYCQKTTIRVIYLTGIHILPIHNKVGVPKVGLI